jgi:hypothetical protein
MKKNKTNVGLLCGATILAACQVSSASLSYTASIGGSALPGQNYATFDGLPAGSAGGTDGGVNVSFTPDGLAATGNSVSNQHYAVPYLSGNNNLYFPGSSLGPDTTQYLSTGLGSATLMLGDTRYMGLLWGSIDPSNKLQLYNGATLIGTILGSDIISLIGTPSIPNTGVDGTAYVNINSSTAFNKVVMTSGQYSFEFDNVAYGAVPEPSTVVAGALLLLPFGISTVRILRKKQVA